MPQLPPLSADLGFLLSRAGGTVLASVKKSLAPSGLSVRTYSVLTLACERSDGINQRSVAAILGLDPSQIVTLVDDLEGRGLITRTPAPQDRRNKLICATESGHALRAETLAVVQSAYAPLFSGVSDAAMATLRSALQKIALNDVL